MRKRDRVRQLKKLIGEQVWMEPRIEDGKVVVDITFDNGKQYVIDDDHIDQFLYEVGEGSSGERYNVSETGTLDAHPMVVSAACSRRF